MGVWGWGCGGVGVGGVGVGGVGVGRAGGRGRSLQQHRPLLYSHGLMSLTDVCLTVVALQNLCMLTRFQATSAPCTKNSLYFKQFADKYLSHAQVLCVQEIKAYFHGSP